MISKAKFIEFLEECASGSPTVEDQVKSVFNNFPTLKAEAINAYIKILERVFDYYSRFTILMSRKYNECK